MNTPINVLNAFKKYFPSSKCKPDDIKDSYQFLKERLTDKSGKKKEAIATLTPFLTIPNLVGFAWDDVIETLKEGTKLDIIYNCKMSDLEGVKGVILLILGVNCKIGEILTLDKVSEITERYIESLEVSTPLMFMVGECNKNLKGVYNKEYVDAVVVR